MSAGGVSGTVLLVENNKGAFDETARLLRAGGLAVVHVTTAVDAFDILQSPRALDVLLVATQIPGQPSGFTVARMGLRKRQGIPVLLLAAGAEAQADETARSPGPILDRTQPAAHLVEAVRAAITRG
jgi:CheY-like chemotaxis protein